MSKKKEKRTTENPTEFELELIVQSTQYVYFSKFSKVATLRNMNLNVSNWTLHFINIVYSPRGFERHINQYDGPGMTEYCLTNAMTRGCERFKQFVHEKQVAF